MCFVFRRYLGFTLIELLIVVAIIAILAAIAVPNFLEAQVRSKVSRSKTDMRSTAVALESYRIEFSHYPIERASLVNQLGLALPMPYEGLCVLTTPIAYMTSIPLNSFKTRTSAGVTANATGSPADHYAYVGDIYINTATAGSARLMSRPQRAQWALVSDGPEGKNSWGVQFAWGYEELHSWPALGAMTAGCLYDPTNGTVSDGDIVRTGP
jgi:prepilin-type N-terminal cleavage/methylation domain-containing protein